MTAIRQTKARCDTPSERRDDVARRFKTFWPVSLRTALGINRAHILNVSRTGAKVHSQQPVDAEQALEIAICDQWFSASVRWRCGETFGIAFDQPVSDIIVQGCLNTR